jgi:hypothetical protein
MVWQKSMVYFRVSRNINELNIFLASFMLFVHEVFHVLADNEHAFLKFILFTTAPSVPKILHST